MNTQISLQIEKVDDAYFNEGVKSFFFRYENFKLKKLVSEYLKTIKN